MVTQEWPGGKKRTGPGFPAPALIHVMRIALILNSSVLCRSSSHCELVERNHRARHRCAVDCPIDAGRDRAPVADCAGRILVERVVECRPPVNIRTCRRIEAGDAFVAAQVAGGPQVLRESLLIEFAHQSAYLLALLSPTTQDGASQLRPPARCSAQFLAPAWGGELLVAEVMLDDAAEGVVLHEMKKELPLGALSWPSTIFLDRLLGLGIG